MSAISSPGGPQGHSGNEAQASRTWFETCPGRAATVGTTPLFFKTLPGAIWIVGGYGRAEVSPRPLTANEREVARAVATGVDHLLRRHGVYWRRRRRPRAIASDPNQRIARSLHTADPGVAHRRARACSPAFDLAVLLAATEDPACRLDTFLTSVDGVFAHILRDVWTKKARA